MECPNENSHNHPERVRALSEPQHRPDHSPSIKRHDNAQRQDVTLHGDRLPARHLLLLFLVHLHLLLLFDGEVVFGPRESTGVQDGFFVNPDGVLGFFYYFADFRPEWELGLGDRDGVDLRMDCGSESVQDLLKVVPQQDRFPGVDARLEDGGSSVCVVTRRAGLSLSFVVLVVVVLVGRDGSGVEGRDEVDKTDRTLHRRLEQER